MHSVCMCVCVCLCVCVLVYMYVHLCIDTFDNLQIGVCDENIYINKIYVLSISI